MKEDEKTTKEERPQERTHELKALKKERQDDEEKFKVKKQRKRLGEA